MAKRRNRRTSSAPLETQADPLRTEVEVELEPDDLVELEPLPAPPPVPRPAEAPAKRRYRAASCTRCGAEMWPVPAVTRYNDDEDEDDGEQPRRRRKRLPVEDGWYRCSNPRCPSGGSPERLRRQFCSDCGRELSPNSMATRCPDCRWQTRSAAVRAELMPSARKYCRMCGAPITDHGRERLCRSCVRHCRMCGAPISDDRNGELCARCRN